MTTVTRTARTWPAPTVIGILLVAVFIVLVVSSPVLRHYWPLLVLSATAAALPFLLLRETAAAPQRALSIEDVAPSDNASVGAAMSASGVSMPKAAAADGENDDAFGIDTEFGCIAVADGASSSYRAGEWAQMLCELFLKHRPLRAMASASWVMRATAEFQARDHQTAEWWSNEAAHRGAHAAFVGLAIVRSTEQLTWRATAVGDCVLVHIRAAAGTPIVTPFPIAHSASFPSNPPLLSSAVETVPPVAYIEGTAQLGDVWLLMTDEIARWALRRHESGDPAWSVLVSGTDADIAAAVTGARIAGDVADDDMTVVRCQLVESGPYAQVTGQVACGA